LYALGLHLLVELYDCDSSLLDDIDLVRDLLIDVTESIQCNILHTFFHKFSPKGVTGVVVISESHLSIHTWPEEGYAAIDIFTCNTSANLNTLIEKLATTFKSSKCVPTLIHRGLVWDTK